MYQDYLLGFEHEAMMCLSAPDGRTRRLIFFRTTDHDFDERERLLLALLRPHLNEAYQDLQRRRAAGPTLTQQQRRVLRLVADGLSNKEIARELVVSATTVRTHLEKIFVTLDVTSRGAAVAKAFPRPPF
jgi:ATP/maltotriose-dependent transcriptional regulator MalT